MEPRCVTGQKNDPSPALASACPKRNATCLRSWRNRLAPIPDLHPADVPAPMVRLIAGTVPGLWPGGSRRGGGATHAADWLGRGTGLLRDLVLGM